MKTFRSAFCVSLSILMVAIEATMAQVNWERVYEGILYGVPVKGLYSREMNWTKPDAMDTSILLVSNDENGSKNDIGAYGGPNSESYEYLKTDSLITGLLG